jgi:hypothetical protein
MNGHRRAQRTQRLCVLCALRWLTVFGLQAPSPKPLIFRSGLDIFPDSGEDLRLNKSEISQASGFLRVSKSRELIENFYPSEVEVFFICHKSSPAARIRLRD